jgi:hypothetical protein
MRSALCVDEDNEQSCENKVWAHPKTKGISTRRGARDMKRQGTKDKQAGSCNPVQAVHHETDITSSEISTLCKTGQEGQRSHRVLHREVRDGRVGMVNTTHNK